MTPEDPAVLKINESATSSLEMSSNPRPAESLSIFDDGGCGEPLLAQHLVIDFTPVEELDNDFVQRKCCAFWDYISNQAELQHMMLLPESITYPEKSEQDTSFPETDKSERVISTDKTAVSMLEFVEIKGLIDRTFEARLPQTHCSLGSREYHEDTTTTLFRTSSHKKNVCTCRGVCALCTKKRPGVEPTPESSPEVKSMCKKMLEWDRERPKSMEPPGHPPALSHAIMQRKIIY